MGKNFILLLGLHFAQRFLQWNKSSHPPPPPPSPPKELLSNVEFQRQDIRLEGRRYLGQGRPFRDPSDYMEKATTVPLGPPVPCPVSLSLWPVQLLLHPLDFLYLQVVNQKPCRGRGDFVGC